MIDADHPTGTPQSLSAGQELGDIAKMVFYALVIALTLRIFVFQPFTIPSASMEPNLQVGDYIFVSKSPYGISRHSFPFSLPLFEGRLLGRAPQRGDIVVFKLPRDGRTDYIKRLVGLPGDRIQVRQSVLYINGLAVPRKALAPVMVDSGYGFTRNVMRWEETLSNGRRYVVYDYGPDQELDNTPVYLVPTRHYFVVGDNRDNSLDSRVPANIGVGFVPEENLVGRAEMIMLSWDKGAVVLKPWTWFSKARPARILSGLR